MFENVRWDEIGQATLDTLLMLGGSLALTVPACTPAPGAFNALCSSAGSTSSGSDAGSAGISVSPLRLSAAAVSRMPLASAR